MTVQRAKQARQFVRVLHTRIIVEHQTGTHAILLWLCFFSREYFKRTLRAVVWNLADVESISSASVLAY